MKKVICVIGVICLILVLAGCSNGNKSKIEGVSDEVYQRGIDFIDYLDKTPMVGQQEGEFDEDLFEAMVQKVVVKSASEFEFQFESGEVIMVKA